ncbi:hypothetical protein Bca4012_040263 [Brassica carinata]
MANPQMVMLVINSSRPRFRNNHDKVAFVVHATLVASGYKLVVVGRPALAEDSPAQGDKLLVVAVAEGATEPAHLKIRVKRYAAESREEGDYDAQFKNLDRLVTKLQNQILYKLDEGLKPVAYTTRTSSKRNREPDEPVYYPRRPFPLGPQFHHPSGVVVVDRPDYSNLIPGPHAGIFPVVSDAFGDGSMLVEPHDLGMLHRFCDQIQRGFMGSSQPILPPPGARYDPIGPGFETGRFGR